jgi:DNA modification methylase
MSGTYGKYNTSRINSKDGSRYPYDILFYEEEFTDWIYSKTAQYEGTYHPTQKPIDLGRWLIRTYTRPGDIVLDNACGSGSFLVAAILEQRHFIGIEKNDRSYHFNQSVNFIDICNRRVKDALRQRGSTLQLFKTIDNKK